MKTVYGKSLLSNKNKTKEKILLPFTFFLCLFQYCLNPENSHLSPFFPFKIWFKNGLIQYISFMRPLLIRCRTHHMSEYTNGALSAPLLAQLLAMLPSQYAFPREGRELTLKKQLERDFGEPERSC